MRAIVSRVRCVGCASLVVGWVAVAAVSAQDASRGLPDYRQEVQLLSGVPGASSSVGAGWLNPAVWHILPEGGLFLAWSDSVGSRERAGRADEILGVVSLRALGFGVRSVSVGPDDELREYALGFAGGDRSHAFGLSYTWQGGAEDLLERHRRLTLGEVHRWRFLSVGTSAAFDLERKDNYGQIDLGLRPFGPRLTLLADAVTRYDESFEDLTFGYGLEARPVPGLILAVKADDLGEDSAGEDLGTRISYRMGFTLGAGGFHPDARLHFDDDGHHRGTTYAVELGGPGVGLGHGLLGRGTSYPEIDLGGQTTYRRYRIFDDRRTLLGTLAELDRLAQDPKVGGVVLNLSGARMDPATWWELREQLAGFRAAGKTVTVYCDRLGMGGYMLASVADRIWMDPEGEITMPGITLGRTYMRGAFEKLGLGIAELRFFKYKSAMESFSLKSMSEADREQLGAYVDEAYATIARTATVPRGLSLTDWDRLVDEKGLLIAREAQAAGLVDSLGTWDDAQKGASKTPRRATGDVSTHTLAGVTGDPVWGPLAWGEPDRIALLYAIGECSMESGIKGRMLSKKIKAAREDGRIKAVVLRADSPGGDPLPSDLVARELRETAKVKPVIVSQGQVAGSGGYWISMYGDSILATPFTITGSIGVISGYIWDEGLGDKLGITYDFVKRGEHADLDHGMVLPLINATVPERPMTDAERARAEETIRALYDDFVGQVAEGRGMSKEAVHEVGQGRIWAGTTGKDQGLVDEIGGLWASLQLARAAAGLGAGRPVVIEEGPELGLFDFGAFMPKLLSVGLPSLGGGGGDDRPARDPEDAGPWALALEQSLARRILGEERFALLPSAERFYLESILRARGRPIMVMDPLAIRCGEEGF